LARIDEVFPLVCPHCGGAPHHRLHHRQPDHARLRLARSKCLSFLDAVTLTVLKMNLTLPVSVFTLLAYVLGMMTGGALMGFARSACNGATQARR